MLCYCIIVAKLIKAPYFFLAVGSQANVGGAASGPIVASDFTLLKLSVGVMLAVVGYVGKETIRPVLDKVPFSWKAFPKLSGIIYCILDGGFLLIPKMFSIIEP